MSVLLPHHPRKGKTLAGQAARGSGALPSFVDIIIEMNYYAQPDDLDRRRRLVAYSRHDDTPRHLLIELNADGTDYAVLQSGLEAAMGDSWPALLHALSDAQSKLTRQEILHNWPADYQKPDSTTLWRWLSRAVAAGTVPATRSATGCRRANRSCALRTAPKKNCKPGTPAASMRCSPALSRAVRQKSLLS
jgi:hypothetical protein